MTCGSAQPLEEGDHRVERAEAGEILVAGLAVRTSTPSAPARRRTARGRSATGDDPVALAMQDQDRRLHLADRATASRNGPAPAAAAGTNG